MNALERARETERELLPRVPADRLPRFHVTGGVGWINDPNGFSVYKGEVHLFFQYHPYDRQWGPMHWGHVKSRDFIRWERLPCALAPDMPYDRDGCFSGSAVELPDGRHLLMYTGVRNVPRADGTAESRQTQCVAVGDGVDYVKDEHNPVLDAEDLPEGGSAADFRDPKIWREGGKYRAVVGNRAADGAGSVLLFESEDALHWRFVSVLDASRNQLGGMWECPDFFPLDGKHVLLTSPQDMPAGDPAFLPGSATLCIIGHPDRDGHGLVREAMQTVDWGTDFYAPQTTSAPDGRRIMIAWMQSWASSRFTVDGLPFFGQMTLPRELRIRDGRLLQNPVRELEAYRRSGVRHRDVTVSGETALPGVRGRFIDMTVRVRPGPGGMYNSFGVTVAGDGEHVAEIRHCPRDSTIRLDRSRSVLPHDVTRVRDFPVAARDELTLRIVLDRFSLEVFVNGGEQAASVVLYTPVSADAIAFSCDGTAVVDVEKYDLEVSS